MQRALPLAVCFTLALPALAGESPKKAGARTHKAHAHGSVELGIAVDGTNAEVDLEAPAEALFGFEHAPKTDAQKKLVTDTLAILREKPEQLFAFAGDAACKPTSVKVSSTQEDAMKGNEHPAHGKDRHGHEGGDEHAEVEARWTFACKTSLAGTKLQLGLVKTFPRMQRVELSLVSGSKQSGKVLTKDEVVEL
jgi:hypothetical protein